jgi:hypothetical protein
MSFWQVRVLASAAPFALLGGLSAADALARRVAASPSLQITAASVAILAFASSAWLLALPTDPRTPAQTAMAEAKQACLDPDALRPLAALPPGRTVAPIDSGAHLLEATRLAVFAGPYHRNDDGNRYAFQVFLAPPDAARTLLLSRSADYVILCPGTTDMQRLTAEAPAGLAARLQAGTAPDFLTPIQVAGTPYKVYAVRRSGS